MAYARVATVEQTVESQKNAIVDFAKNEGLSIDKFYEVHGSTEHSKATLADALGYMVHSGINKLVALDPSRISRNVDQLINIEKEFIDQGKEIVYV
ncbi:recombinase family protein [Paenibacillus polysaccharolyticus]|uniref:recombinase family protein n=1 Tax=Paenibacillus polysaccharolyticus TaxID=582692 RepID=UPI0030B8CBFF